MTHLFKIWNRFLESHFWFCQLWFVHPLNHLFDIIFLHLTFWFKMVSCKVTSTSFCHCRSVGRYFPTAAQKMKFSIKDFFRKCDQIPSFLRIWSHLLKKTLTGKFIFCAVQQGHVSYWLVRQCTSQELFWRCKVHHLYCVSTSLVLVLLNNLHQWAAQFLHWNLSSTHPWFSPNISILGFGLVSQHHFLLQDHFWHRFLVVLSISPFDEKSLNYSCQLCCFIIEGFDSHDGFSPPDL